MDCDSYPPASVMEVYPLPPNIYVNESPGTRMQVYQSPSDHVLKCGSSETTALLRHLHLPPTSPIIHSTAPVCCGRNTRKGRIRCSHMGNLWGGEVDHLRLAAVRASPVRGRLVPTQSCLIHPCDQIPKIVWKSTHSQDPLRTQYRQTQSILQRPPTTEYLGHLSTT